MPIGTTSLTIVAVIAVIAVLALVVAVVLRRQVLAAPEGTPGMRAIATAIQEGAQAYLNRQFRCVLTDIERGTIIDIIVATPIEPSSLTTGFFTPEPTARIAPWGGLMTAS